MKGIDLDVEARTLVMARVIARMGIVSQVGYELLQGSRSQERLRLRIYVLIRTTDPVRMFGPGFFNVVGNKQRQSQNFQHPHDTESNLVLERPRRLLLRGNLIEDNNQLIPHLLGDSISSR